MDVAQSVGDLKDAIKKKNVATITCDAKDIKFFLAKKKDGNWLTENEVLRGESDTDGRPYLRVVGAELALAGLSEDEVRAQVDTREVAAGNGPVHVLARVSELGLPVKRAASDDNATPAKRRKDIRTEWTWKEEGDPIYSLEGDHMFFVRATQQLLKILKSNHNRVQTKFGGQWVMPIMDNVVGLGKTAFVHPETQG
ncbi:hypothetical protein JG688_00005817 [Phytophthora aleatoria]|uniref:Crinkler effector protein N-terminal domain-containing protein n=1 Tax=Phytophthora aleatoria TaxID=2496075 RepID=A0A8J5IRE6_9STRA|nr:hypothetical protein JG688_00005817 [Phytophthora aleatoria]